MSTQLGAAPRDAAAKTTGNSDAAENDERRRDEIDAIVDVAAASAAEFRKLDQAQVDRIVEAMVRAGVRAAAELAGLAIEETGFGVFEDKVVKNYVATEFLHDYLRDKKSVGVVDEDIENNIVHVAEPIGVVLAITPVTNPTSTVLFKAIVAAKTRNAVVFRPSPYAVRSCERSVEILRAAAEAAGMPPGALQVIPDAAHEVTHYRAARCGTDTAGILEKQRRRSAPPRGDRGAGTWYATSRSPQRVDGLIASCTAPFGRLDVLVNTATARRCHREQRQCAGWRAQHSQPHYARPRRE